MDINELYAGLKRIQVRGEIGNAYCGCGTVPSDFDVLDNFYEYILDKYEDSMPLWAETFVQIYSWQFQTLHECAQAYYENVYGFSDYETILQVEDYLRKNGYDEIAAPYGAAAVNCDGSYPANKSHLLPDIWIGSHDKTVWNFYVDILETHKEELLSGR